MKIIDETGAVIENPDLTLGYLTTSTEEVAHPAVEGVEEQWHWETVTEYPNGGRDVQKIVDRPGVQAQKEWVEKVPIQKYIRYTAEELSAQEEARKKQEAKDKLPETVAELQEDPRNDRHFWLGPEQGRQHCQRLHQQQVCTDLSPECCQRGVQRRPVRQPDLR